MTDRNEIRQFVLQAEDLETGAPTLEARLHIKDITALRGAIGGASDDPHLMHCYQLSSEELNAVAALSTKPFIPDTRLQTLVPWHSLREAPYLIHTDFELPLMIEGRKPLAVFQDAYPSGWFERQMKRFDPFVEEGRFIRRVVDEPWSESRPSPTGYAGEGLRKVYIAKPDQAWRIDAFMLMEKVAERCQWNETLERFQGSLLGYEDWQNDWWIERIRAGANPAGL